MSSSADPIAAALMREANRQAKALERRLKEQLRRSLKRRTGETERSVKADADATPAGGAEIKGQVGGAAPFFARPRPATTVTPKGKALKLPGGRGPQFLPGARIPAQPARPIAPKVLASGRRDLERDTAKSIARAAARQLSRK